MNEVKLCENNEINHLMKNILNNALKEIMSAVKAECGSLYLFDLEHKELVLDAFHNSANLFLKGLRQRIGEGIAGKIIGMKMPVLVKNIDEDSRFERNGFGHYRTGSFISIPLSNSKGMLGLINLADKATGEPFSEEDLRLAVSMANYACVVMDSLSNNMQLKDKYASVGKLAAGIVHEINNPLDGIIRYTNILLNQVENNTVINEYLLEIKRGLDRIAGITKSLLQFSHQVNSSASNTENYVGLQELIADSLNVLGDKINGATQIVKKYKKDLPPIMDMGLGQVFTNIIKNAVDAMPQGGTLEISTAFSDSLLEISFKDAGKGIPAEIQERIFEPFFTTKSIDKGTGLGLAICREIIAKYEGEIRVSSLPEKGSTFTIAIPRKYLKDV
jgi:signal transduction histidine kinase